MLLRACLLRQLLSCVNLCSALTRSEVVMRGNELTEMLAADIAHAGRLHCWESVGRLLCLGHSE